MNMTTLILFGSFVLFLVLGLPVSISLGLSSLVSFLYCGIPIVTIAQRLYTGMDSFPLMAIPLFILAGNLMTAGGISRKIVDFANILTGRVRGGLAYTAILACAIFAALSGSGPATTIAIGAMIYPSMKEIKYPKAQSAGLMAVAGGLGPVIPPSIIMVIYSTLVGCSVTNMFSAGIFWGIFTVIVLAGVVFVISRKDKWPKAGVQKHTARELLGVIARTLPALAVPLIILGGIYSGFFTPTESAGIACVAAYLIGRFVYKEISLHNLPTILVDSAKQSTVIMFIIACATAFSYFFSYAGLTKSLTQFVLSCHMSPTVFLLFCFVLLVIFGMFMDGTSIAVLLVPLLWPVAKELGIDVIHFGIVFCILNSLGCCTPPVAVNLFGMANISGLSVGEITKGEMPFFIANLCVVLLIIFVPAVTAWVVG